MKIIRFRDLRKKHIFSLRSALEGATSDVNVVIEAIAVEVVAVVVVVAVVAVVVVAVVNVVTVGYRAHASSELKLGAIRVD